MSAKSYEPKKDEIDAAPLTKDEVDKFVEAMLEVIKSRKEASDLNTYDTLQKQLNNVIDIVALLKFSAKDFVSSITDKEAKLLYRELENRLNEYVKLQLEETDKEKKKKLKKKRNKLRVIVEELQPNIPKVLQANMEFQDPVYLLSDEEFSKLEVQSSGTDLSESDIEDDIMLYKPRMNQEPPKYDGGYQSSFSKSIYKY